MAAYPVAGPLDVVGNSGVGVLDEDLGRGSAQGAANLADQCRRYAQKFGWTTVTQQFLCNLQPIRRVSRRMAA